MNIRAIALLTGALFVVNEARANDRPSISYAGTIGYKNFRALDPAKGYILVEGEGYVRAAFAKIIPVENGGTAPAVQSIWELQPRYHLRINEDGTRLYLLEVEPGLYAFYSLIHPVEGGGVSGLCACMGSLSFNVSAGQVTSFGSIRSMYLKWLDGGVKVRFPDVMLTASEDEGGIHVVPKLLSDERIPKHAVVTPNFYPIQRMPNWYGLFVDRLRPMAGVFKYSGDRQIDNRDGS